MVILLGMAAAVLYGTGDFLGGLATRRVQVLAVLLLAQTAGVIIALPAAAMWPGPASLAGLAWGTSAGLIGGAGLIIFYLGLAAGPMSVVAPVSGLVSTILPVAVALAGGERPGDGVYAGALLCLAAIVLASSAGDPEPARSIRAAPRPRLPGVGRALGYGIASGAAFGLFRADPRRHLLGGPGRRRAGHLARRHGAVHHPAARPGILTHGLRPFSALTEQSFPSF